MLIIETLFNPLIPLPLIEDFVKRYFGWEEGCFSAIKIQYSDYKTKVFLDHPTDLLNTDVEELLKFFHSEILNFNSSWTKQYSAIKPDIVVNSGALNMVLNVLRRAGKDEVADELEKTATRL